MINSPADEAQSPGANEMSDDGIEPDPSAVPLDQQRREAQTYRGEHIVVTPLPRPAPMIEPLNSQAIDDPNSVAGRLLTANDGGASVVGRETRRVVSRL